MSQNRPYEPRSLSPDLTGKLDDFLAQHDFPNMYRSYSWNNDTHSAGFPDILCLEARFRDRISKPEDIVLEDIRCVVHWGGGGPEEIGRIKITDKVRFLRIARRLHEPQIAGNPEFPARDLDYSVNGIGPTYVSKVLRFAMPTQYGVIDTRLVGAFGSNSNRRWVQLIVEHQAIKRPIKRPGTSDDHWYPGYDRWVNILRYLALRLHEESICCPHPQQFVDNDLRDAGVWTCADVEMALFAYT